MALCLLIVAGSVLFGIFGPGIAQRSMLGGGVSIGDLISNAMSLRDQLLWQALDLRARNSVDDRDRTLRAGAAATIERIIGPSYAIPDLSPAGYQLASWSAVSLRGERDDSVALGYLDQSDKSFVALYITADEGRFVVFDGFGRPLPLLPDRLFSENVERSAREHGVALIWSNGPVLSLAIVDSPEVAEELRVALGAP